MALITEASDMQAEGIQQVTIGIDQISAVIQTNSATAQESAASSEELSSQANLLKTLVDRFQIKGMTSPIQKQPELPIETTPVSFDTSSDNDISYNYIPVSESEYEPEIPPAAPVSTPVHNRPAPGIKFVDNNEKY